MLQCLVKNMWGFGIFKIYLAGSCQLNWICNCIWKFSDLFSSWDLEENCKPVHILAQDLSAAASPWNSNEAAQVDIQK